MKSRVGRLVQWFSARPTISRSSRRAKLNVEVLEDRSLLSVAPIAMNVHGLADSLVIGNTFFFSTAAGELWKTDGTPAGTALVKDLFPDSHVAFDIWGPNNFTDDNGTLFFTAADPTSGDAELWKSNGTDAGTVLVKDFGPGTNGAIFSSQFTPVNGSLFFTTSFNNSGNELWKSDGTDAGTAVVKQLSLGYDFLHDTLLANVNGTLFFSTKDFVNGARLWTSDGTDAGTVVLATDANLVGAFPP